MARIKRFQQYVWYRSVSGNWSKHKYGGSGMVPMTKEYRASCLSHQNDKLEAIIGESFDDEDRLILLAKWEGFPAEEATWELQWRFKAHELEAWHQEKLRLASIVKEAEADGVREPLDLCRSQQGLYSNRKCPEIYMDPEYVGRRLGVHDKHLKKSMVASGMQKIDRESGQDGATVPGDDKTSTSNVEISISYWKRYAVYNRYTGEHQGYTFDMMGTIRPEWANTIGKTRQDAQVQQESTNSELSSAMEE